jgi:hypothetical protein
MGFLEVSANPLLYLQQCTRPLPAAAYSRVVMERKHVGQKSWLLAKNCLPPMNVLSPLIPAWKAISLRTPKPPCAVTVVSPVRIITARLLFGKAAGFPGFQSKSQLWPVVALTDMAIFGCSRLERQFFRLHAAVRPSWLLLSESSALLAVQMRSLAQCHGDLLDTPKGEIITRSVADIHATPGLRHSCCNTFPCFSSF